MKKFSSLMLIFACLSVICGACDKKSEPENGGGSSGEGGYGNLNGNLITIGSSRDVTYTSCVLLGTVDFPKITGDHSYGIDRF